MHCIRTLVWQSYQIGCYSLTVLYTIFRKKSTAVRCIHVGILSRHCACVYIYVLGVYVYV